MPKQVISVTLRIAIDEGVYWTPTIVQQVMDDGADIYKDNQSHLTRYLVDCVTNVSGLTLMHATSMHEPSEPPTRKFKDELQIECAKCGEVFRSFSGLDATCPYCDHYTLDTDLLNSDAGTDYDDDPSWVDPDFTESNPYTPED